MQIPCILCDFKIFFLAGVTVNFSQPIFSASEGDGLVQICVEVVSGHLGTDIARSSSSTRHWWKLTDGYIIIIFIITSRLTTFYVEKNCLFCCY